MSSRRTAAVSQPNRRRRRPLLAVEAVEPRRLLAAATLNGNVLQISGTSAAETITVAGSGANLVVQRNGEAPQSFAKSSVAKIVANLGDGNDVFRVDYATVSTPASINGGAGNDTIAGGTGNDTVDGGSGVDTMSYFYRTAPITASLTMYLITEYDEAANMYRYSTSGQGSGGGSGESDRYTNLETLTGGAGNDTLTVAGAEQGYGYQGSAVNTVKVDGSAGNDTINVNSGQFVANSPVALIADGGAGNDYLDFGGNRDPFLPTTLNGGDGNDTFAGTTYDGYYSAIDGGAGTDLLTSVSPLHRTWTIPAGVENLDVEEATTVIGNSLNNRISFGYGGDASVTGGAGDDTIVASGGNDTIDGGAGNDSILGGDGSDSIRGGAGNDTIDGGAGHDTLDGGTGSDSINGGGQDETGDGSGASDLGDTVTYAGRAEALTIDFSLKVLYFDEGHQSGVFGHGTAKTAAGESDVLTNVEAIVAGEGNDTISFVSGAVASANPSSARLDGGGGDDRFTISSGYFAGDPNISLVTNGNAGNDYFDYGNNRDPVIPLTMNGGDGNDTFAHTSDDGFARMDGGAGIDTYTEDSIIARSFTLQAGIENGYFAHARNVAGNDLDNRIVVSDPAGGQLTVTGGGGNDTIVGTTYSDSIDGGAGNDSILAGDGDDSVRGGDGNDLIDPGAGSDTVDGGNGADAVSYASRSVPVNATLSYSLVNANGAYSVRRDLKATQARADGTAETDAGTNVEVLSGSLGNDTLNGLVNPGNWDGAGSVDRSPLIVNGEAGNDAVLIRGVLNAANNGIANQPGLIANGGDGNDAMTAGQTTAGGGRLDGGNGDDALTFSGPYGLATWAGGAGTDTMKLSRRGAGSQQVTLTMASDVENAEVYSDVRVDVVGNALGNRISVSAPQTSVKGMAGNDTIYGTNGNDTLDGGDNDDRLYGQGGNDTLLGGNGNDSLDGGDGNDPLDGGAGADSLYGGAGTDTGVRDPNDRVINSIEILA